MSRFDQNDIILKNYRIERSIGQGAFGEVYLATHLGLNGKRAVKVLLRDEIGIGSTEYDEYRNRFRQESQLMEWFNHTNIIRVYDFQEEDNTLFLIMEYASGGSLKQKLDEIRGNNSRFDVNTVINLGIDVAEGLSVMHKRDVIHRDLKPSNILFDSEGHAKVADLGLAQVPGGASMRSQLSMPKAHPGTPMYMSPEQEISGIYLRPASDIYSLGLILFEMLSGRSYKNIRPGTHIRDVITGIPDWFDAYLLRMLSDTPKERPWDGAETAEELRKGLQAGDAVMREAREKEQQEALERARLAEQQRIEEERVRKIQEERARQAALEKKRLEEEERQKQAARERLQKEAQERARLAAEEKARREQREKARLEEMEKARLAAEQRRIKEAQERARLAAEEKAKRDALLKAQAEEKEKARLAEQERIRKAAEEKAQKEADEKARLEEQITRLETQGKEACNVQDWPAARGIVKQLKKLGRDGQSAALRLKAEIKDESTPVWKKYWWAGAAGVVVVAGLILWQTGLFTPSPAGTPGTKTAATPAVTSLPALSGTVTVTPSTADSARPGMIQYTVVEGDTLDTVAAKFNVTVDEITAANELQKDTALKAGQSLFVPLKVEVISVNSTPASDINGQPTAIFTPLSTLGIPDIDKDKLLVGIVLPEKDNPPAIQTTSLLQKKLSDLGIKSEVMYYDYDQNKEAKAIHALSDKGAKFLIISPYASNSDIMVAVLEKMRGREDKIITYDKLIYDNSLTDAAITFDPFEIGKAQGEFLVQKAAQRKDIPIYLYAGSKGDIFSTQLFQGAWSVLQPRFIDGTFIIANSRMANQLIKYEDLSFSDADSIINEIGSDWGSDKIANLVKSNLDAAKINMKGDIFVLAPDDISAGYIITSLSTDPSISSYVITGMVADNRSVELIANELQSMTIYKDEHVLVRDAVNTVISYLNNQEPNLPTKVFTGKGYVPSTGSKATVVTKDNYQTLFNESENNWLKNLPDNQNTTLPTAMLPLPTMKVTQNSVDDFKPVPCNKAMFIADVTYPEGSKVLPGEKFTKTWLIKNEGTCTWNKNYMFLLIDKENPFSSKEITLLPHEVAPGQTVNISVDLLAPQKTGKYSTQWILQNDKGVEISDGIQEDHSISFYLTIIVSNN
jgi:TolA protein